VRDPQDELVCVTSTSAARWRWGDGSQRADSWAPNPTGDAYIQRSYTIGNNVNAGGFQTTAAIPERMIGPEFYLQYARGRMTRHEFIDMTAGGMLGMTPARSTRRDGATPPLADRDSRTPGIWFVRSLTMV
jgi:hypothetical protein